MPGNPARRLNYLMGSNRGGHVDCYSVLHRAQRVWIGPYCCTSVEAAPSIGDGGVASA